MTRKYMCPYCGTQSNSDQRMGVTLHHWKSKSPKKESWIVEIGLGGQIRATQHKSLRAAQVYYDSVNEDVIRLAWKIYDLFVEMGDIRLSIIEAMDRAVFEGKPLKPNEKIPVTHHDGS